MICDRFNVRPMRHLQEHVLQLFSLQEKCHKMGDQLKKTSSAATGASDRFRNINGTINYRELSGGSDLKIKR